MDAIVGMEGYGPTAGSPRTVGLLVSSRDPYALDSVAVRLIGLDPRRVPTIVKAEQRGLCAADGAGIRVLGERIEDVALPDFEKPTVKVAFNYYSLFLPRWLKKRLDKVIEPRPRFDHEACVGCGMCAQGCPPRTIEMRDGKPAVDLTRCIRCFCCSELCAHGAVSIFRPWFIRLVLR
jgi:ferredoxin